MKVLMLGWEFPPFISGGLGTACYGLTKGLSDLGTEVLFVLPRPVESSFSAHVKLLKPDHGSSMDASSLSGSEQLHNVKFRALNVRIYPYGNPYKQAVPVSELGMLASPSVTASVGLRETRSSSRQNITQTEHEGN